MIQVWDLPQGLLPDWRSWKALKKPKPPQLTPFNTEEQWLYFKLLLDDGAPQSVSHLSLTFLPEGWRKCISAPCTWALILLAMIYTSRCESWNIPSTFLFGSSLSASQQTRSTASLLKMRPQSFILTCELDDVRKHNSNRTDTFKLILSLDQHATIYLHGFNSTPCCVSTETLQSTSASTTTTLTFI